METHVNTSEHRAKFWAFDPDSTGLLQKTEVSALSSRNSRLLYRSLGLRRQQLSVDWGGGCDDLDQGSATVVLQRCRLIRPHLNGTNPSLDVLLLHPPWWSCGCVPLCGHLLGNQGAGAPSVAWLVASRSQLHRRLGSWCKWSGTPLHIAPPLRVCPSVGLGSPLWCCMGGCE